MKLVVQDVYIFNKVKYLKSEKYNAGKSDSDKEYWYKIEYLYRDKNNNLQYNWEFIDESDFNAIDELCSIGGTPLKFRGHYQQYKFKCDELVR